MKWYALAAVTAALLTPAIAGAQTASSAGHVYAIDAQNGSGEHGTFALKPRGQKTTIEIHLLGAPGGIAQPAHLHVGTCAKLDPSPKYALKSLQNGISETSLAVPMTTLLTEHLALNVHKSAAALPVYVACGNIAP